MSFLEGDLWAVIGPPSDGGEHQNTLSHTVSWECFTVVKQDEAAIGGFREKYDDRLHCPFQERDLRFSVWYKVGLGAEVYGYSKQYILLLSVSEHVGTPFCKES
jgi:hypothetical protein